MTRTYDRDAKHYDRVVLDHLVATGQATFFAAANTYVVKTEDGSFAVRPHQVVDSGLTAPVSVEVVDVVEVRVASPMDGYSGKEYYDGEDTGPGGVVYDSMLGYAEKFLGDNPEGVDPLAVVRRMLDDPSYERLIINEVNGVPVQPIDQSAPARRVRRSGMTAAEEQELLQHFL